MFRGGDYVDQPKFYNNESMPKNSLDVSVSYKSIHNTLKDIAGAKAKSNYPTRVGRDSMSTHDINGKPPMYGGMPSMSPAMIGNTPAYAPPQRVNNVIFGSSDDEYKKQL